MNYKIQKFNDFQLQKESISTTFQEVEELCRKYELENYFASITINDDLSIDVDGDVKLNKRQLTQIPLQFRTVSGNFHCNSNQLTTLIGSPSEVGGSFFCDQNQLSSLINGPKKVGKKFYCNDNPSLISLNGISQCQGFYCSGSPVAEIWNLFQRDKNFLEIFEIYNLFQIPGVIDAAAIEEIAHHLGQTLPENWTLENYTII